METSNSHVIALVSWSLHRVKQTNSCTCEKVAVNGLVAATRCFVNISTRAVINVWADKYQARFFWLNSTVLYRELLGLFHIWSENYGNLAPLSSNQIQPNSCCPLTKTECCLGRHRHDRFDLYCCLVETLPNLNCTNYGLWVFEWLCSR